MLLLKPDDSPGFFTVMDEDGKHVGRIFESKAAPREAIWFWTIDWFCRRGNGPHQGNTRSRLGATIAFRQAWDAGIAERKVEDAAPQTRP